MSGDMNPQAQKNGSSKGIYMPREFTVPTVAEAQAMINQAVAGLGINPIEATDPEGWRHLSLGVAHGMVNVFEWQPGLHFLVIWSPIVKIPEDQRLRAELYETVLKLNNHETGIGRCSLMSDGVVISYVRPIHALDMDEVDDAIRMVMVTADRLKEKLIPAYDVELPKIAMDNGTWQNMASMMRSCDKYSQKIFGAIVEGWLSRKGNVDVGQSGIGLNGITDPSKSLAALIARASAGAIVTLGWNSLVKVSGVTAEAAKAFEEIVPRPKRFVITEGSAHLPVDESFTTAMVEQLLDALVSLDQMLIGVTPPPKPKLPDLQKRWDLRIEVGGATQLGIDSLLESCPKAVQPVYRALIQGWHDAGQPLYTKTEDRVALRLTVGNSTFAICTLYGPQKARPARIELYYPLSYYFDGREEARRRYEQGVARSPGFQAHNSGARIPMDNTFTVKNGEDLLKILRRLAQDTRS